MSLARSGVRRLGLTKLSNEDSISSLTAPRIRFVLLCEYATVENKKLNVIGGGVDAVRVPNPATAQMIGIALGFEVPWSSTDRPFNIEVRMVDEDGHELPTIQGQVTIYPGGANDQMPIGQPIQGSFATNLPINFPKSGTYIIVARIPGGDSDRALIYADVGSR